MSIEAFNVRRVFLTDAEALADLMRTVSDDLATPEAFRLLLRRPPSSPTERLVAEAGGKVVAWAPSGIFESGDGWFWIGVLPDFRRRGIGRTLYASVEERLRGLDARELRTTPSDEEGRRFLAARGFIVATTVRVSKVDPRAVTESARPPAGFEIVSLREATGLVEALYHLYSQGRADIPSETPRPAWSHAEWRAQTLDHPLLDLDASVVVLERGQPVSLAWLYSDREGHRAEALMAATRSDRRGLGLATLAKIESTRRAAELGITRILTSNDLDNAAMLAINRKIGFTSTSVVQSYAKSLSNG